MFFGLIGLIASAGGITYVHTQGIGISESQLSGPVKEELSLMSKTMSDASQSASNAADTTKNAQESLNSASRSIDPISSAVDETAELAEGLCQFPGTDLGCREADNFQSYSIRVNNLERNLGDTAESLQRNSRDMEQMSEDFSKISDSLDSLSQTAPSVAGVGLHRLKLVLSGLLGWIGLLHTAILGIGVMLWKVDSSSKP